MNGEKLKEAWGEVTKAELVGWFVFAGVFSVLFAYYTIFWQMGSDKIEFSYLIFKLIMVGVFLGLGAIAVKVGHNGIQSGSNQVEENELIRSFSGAIFFGLLLSLSLVAEALSLTLRGNQLYEYVQGFFYFGLMTGAGMSWYLVLINHLSKKERQQAGAE